MLHRSLFLLLLVALLPASPASLNAEPAERPRQIILLIGDGMGLSHLTAAGVKKGAPLAVERCEVVGLTRTHSADHLVTDSAAAGTALATGVKTRNQVLGLNPAGERVPSLMEVAQSRGMASGFVVTSAVTHATPAAFYAHQQSRKDTPAIVEDLFTSEVDVAIGGGRAHFAQPDESGGQSGQKLGQKSDRLGRFRVIHHLTSAVNLPKGPLLALLAADWLPPARERGDLLLRGLQLALGRLEENPGGFFLMVEGSQIDYYSHHRDAPMMLDELLDFDRAVTLALDYADSHPGTLVIITADHETGGYALIDGDPATRSVQSGWIHHQHTAAMVPLFAHGPGAGAFAGVYDNTEVFHRLMRVMGWSVSP